MYLNSLWFAQPDLHSRHIPYTCTSTQRYTIHRTEPHGNDNRGVTWWVLVCLMELVKFSLATTKPRWDLWRGFLLFKHPISFHRLCALLPLLRTTHEYDFVVVFLAIWFSFHVFTSYFLFECECVCVCESDSRKAHVNIVNELSACRRKTLRNFFVWSTRFSCLFWCAKRITFEIS